MSIASFSLRPTGRSVFREQFTTAGLRLRIPLLLYAAIFVALGINSLASHAARGTAYHLHPTNLGNLLLLPALFAPVVWKNESISRREYHLSMPIEARRHQILKTATAWG